MRGYGYGLLLPQTQADLGITSRSAGLIASAAYASYLVANVGVVWLTVRWGQRLPIALASVLAVSGMAAAATASTPLGAAVGAAAGLALPPYADIVAQHVPAARRRALAWSTISYGGSVTTGSGSPMPAESRPTPAPRPSPEPQADRYLSPTGESKTTASPQPAGCGPSPRSCTTNTHAHYQRRRDHGDRHSSALRHLFNRQLGQLWHCLKNGQLYDPDRAFAREAETATEPPTTAAA